MADEKYIGDFAGKEDPKRGFHVTPEEAPKEAKKPKKEDKPTEEDGS